MIPLLSQAEAQHYAPHTGDMAPLRPPLDVHRFDPHVPGGTVGEAVVALANRLSMEEPNAAAAQALRRQLQEIGTGLVQLPEDEVQKFEPYARTLLGEPPRQASERSILDDIIATPNTLLRFMRLQVGVIAEEQIDGTPLFAKAKDKFIGDTERGIREGWISPEAVRVRRDMRRRPVFVADYWRTHHQGRAGSLELDTDAILVSQGLGATRSERARHLAANTKAVFDHEANHASFEPKFWEYPDGRVATVTIWYREAMAEHISLVKEFGSVDILDPASRSHDSGVYSGLRSLGAYATSHAPGGRIHPSYLTRAYTCDNFDSPDWQAMEFAFDNVWGADRAFWRISEICDTYRRFLGSKYGDTWSWDKIYNEAAVRTQRDLQEDPRRVFGRDWVSPIPATRYDLAA